MCFLPLIGKDFYPQDNLGQSSRQGINPGCVSSPIDPRQGSRCGVLAALTCGDGMVRHGVPVGSPTIPKSLPVHELAGKAQLRHSAPSLWPDLSVLLRSNPCCFALPQPACSGQLSPHLDNDDSLLLRSPPLRRSCLHSEKTLILHTTEGLRTHPQPSGDSAGPATPPTTQSP